MWALCPARGCMDSSLPRDRYQRLVSYETPEKEWRHLGRHQPFNKSQQKQQHLPTIILQSSVRRRERLCFPVEDWPQGRCDQRKFPRTCQRWTKRTNFRNTHLGVQLALDQDAPPHIKPTTVRNTPSGSSPTSRPTAPTNTPPPASLPSNPTPPLACLRTAWSMP